MVTPANSLFSSVELLSRHAA